MTRGRWFSHPHLQRGFLLAGRPPRTAQARRFPPPRSSAGIALFYTDVVDGPVTGWMNNAGVPVTASGINFGATQGAGSVKLSGSNVAVIWSWSDTEIVFQIGSGGTSGNFTITNNAGQSVTGCLDKPTDSANDFTVRAGSIVEVTTANAATQLTNIVAGDTRIIRAGTYNGIYNASAAGPFETWEIDKNHSGTTLNHINVLGYPGELPRFNGQPGRGPCIHLNQTSAGNQAHHLTFSNLYLNGGLDGGATLSVTSSGGDHVRLVNCTITAEVWGTSTVSTGAVNISGSYCHVLGNEFKLIGLVDNNQAHSLYIQIGASHNRIRWNYFHDNYNGAQVQMHTDENIHDGASVSGPFFFDDNWVDSNIFTSTGNHARGVTASDMTADSNLLVTNNLFYNCGANAGALILLQGSHKAFNNVFYNCTGSAIVVDTFTANRSNGDQIKNNIIVSTSGVPYYTKGAGSTVPVDMDNNCFSGNGAGPGIDAHAINASPLFTNAAAFDFTLQGTSPCRNAAVATTPAVSYDRNGVPRPQGAASDLGAFENA